MTTTHFANVTSGSPNKYTPSSENVVEKQKVNRITMYNTHIKPKIYGEKITDY